MVSGLDFANDIIAAIARYNSHALTLSQASVEIGGDALNAGATLAVAATSLPTAVVGVAYAKALKATGGYTPYSWSISAGHLPAGMTLTSAGELSGKPTTAGTFAITVRVEDASHPALTATAKLSLVVDSR